MRRGAAGAAAERKAASGLHSFFATQMDPGLTWDVLAYLRTITALPVLLKGILHAEDAAAAVEAGAAGIIVSNHGGRQADYTGECVCDTGECA